MAIFLIFFYKIFYMENELLFNHKKCTNNNPQIVLSTTSKINALINNINIFNEHIHNYNNDDLNHILDTYLQSVITIINNKKINNKYIDTNSLSKIKTIITLLSNQPNNKKKEKYKQIKIT
tara:strand:- start:16179 stop:16541 length:363 start_codon:yes stop_codon:yes gene_type:complete